MSSPPDAGQGWAGPAAAAGAGVLSVPLLLVSDTSFVLALCLAAAGLLAGCGLLLVGVRPRQRPVAALGAVGGLATLALLVVPFVRQE